MRVAEGGFTLIELLIVMAIVAIVAAITIPNLLASKLNANETGAIATLRNLVSAQAQLAVSSRVDADGDGKGEYGTFLELAAVVGVRKGFVGGAPAGSDFSVKGALLNPPILSAVFARVDANGFTTKGGYALMIYLPDAGLPAGFVHETFAGGTAALAGGTATVGIDNAEVLWCAYAQPIHFGGSGTRRFFTGHKGDLVQSGNDVARSGGVNAAIQADAAFLGANITSPVAIGTRGRDGDTWKVVN
jgi:type IV pilus assembly protein PilA